MTIRTFRDTFARIVPPWLSGATGSRLLYSIGVHLDALMDMATDGVKMRFPGLVDPAAVGVMGKFGEDTLPFIGRDRRFVRGPGETAQAYAARMSRWREAHRRRGTSIELLRQVHEFYGGAFKLELVSAAANRYTMATDGTVTRDVAPGWILVDIDETWASWRLFYHWPSVIPPVGTWGDGTLWGDGSVWGSGLSPETVAELRTVPEAWNAAHCSGTLVLLPPGDEIADYTFGEWPNQIGIT